MQWKPFGEKIDGNLTFEEHVEGLCKIANLKVSALARISSSIRFEQRTRIVNSFITSHLEKNSPKKLKTVGYRNV